MSTKKSILLLSYFDPDGISTIVENINYLKDLSVFQFEVVNFFKATMPFRISAQVDLNQYYGVLIHNTISYNPLNLQFLDELTVSFSSYKGIKILFKQDEQYKTYETIKYIKKNKIDLVLTCLDDVEREKVYPADEFPDTHFLQMLTGYVTPKMRELHYDKENRAIDIGYRGSIQPLIFGELAYEKHKIGEDISQLARKRGWKVDISSKWKDRKQGQAWYDFLAQCKATLGAESGANVFDMDGRLEHNYARLKHKYKLTNEKKSKNAQKIVKFLKEFPGQVNYNQISPRHFEAAATKTLQILYEGEYSGILKPWVHYASLKKDYSNLDEVAEILFDQKRRFVIIEQAYHDLVVSDIYWIERFVKKFDDAVGSIIKKEPKPIKHYLLLASHYPKLDPRIRWIVEGAPDSVKIHVLGINKAGANLQAVQMSKTYQDTYEVTVPRDQLPFAFLMSDFYRKEGYYNQAQIEMAILVAMSNLSDQQIVDMIGKVNNLHHFRFYLMYFVHVNSVLYNMAFKFSRLSGVIATDLATLPAGFMLKKTLKIPLVYDAHEYWPGSSAEFSKNEENFWVGMEQRLLPEVDYAVTVSEPMAQYLTNLYQHDFSCMPNCETANAADVIPYIDSELEVLKARGNVLFLFQGNFAPGRGIEHLIRVWATVNQEAVLILRGPDVEFKHGLIKLAREIGLLDKRIFFASPVDESNLVAAAKQCDVGLIPYEPIIINNQYCCPNKLSQYLAAGLPIISNKLDYVASVLEKADCGRVVNFSDQNMLSKVINEYCVDKSLRARRAYQASLYFTTVFNWENLSQELYKSLENLGVSMREEILFDLKSAVMPAGGFKNKKFFETVITYLIRGLKRTGRYILPPAFRAKARTWLLFLLNA